MGLLKLIRLNSGLSQATMAKRLAQSQGEVSRAERRSDVKLTTIAKWAKALDQRLVLSVGGEEYEVTLHQAVRRI